MTMSEAETKDPAVAPRVIRDKGFAKRLETACERNPHCPTNGRGKQKWLYEALFERFAVKVSPEAARKWFAGETRPKPKLMAMIAQILEVDEAWLSLGITPDETPVEKRKRNAMADGAVNYVAGLIQMAGGNIAFPVAARKDSHEADLTAIVGGQAFQIEVKMANPADDTNMHWRVRVPHQSLNNIVLTVVEKLEMDNSKTYDILHLPTEVVSKQGKSRGGFFEIDVFGNSRDGYKVERSTLPKVRDMKRLRDLISAE